MVESRDATTVCEYPNYSPTSNKRTNESELWIRIDLLFDIVDFLMDEIMNKSRDLDNSPLAYNTRYHSF